MTSNGASPAAPADLPLASAFPAVGPDAWLELVAGVLRKSGALGPDAPAADALDALTSLTAEGLRLRPLYTRSDADADVAGYPGVFPYVRGARARGGHDGGWDVRAWHADPDVARTRAAVVADLENGAHSLWLEVGAGAIPVAGLEEVLADVYLDSAAVALDPRDDDPSAAAEALLAAATARGYALAALTGSLGIDPVARQARTAETADFGAALTWVERALAELPGLRPVVVDGLPYHEAGASDAQELAYVLAAAVATLRALEEAGVGPDRAAPLLTFRYAVTDEQFLSVAKLRAARQLWARVAQASGATGGGAAQHQHAVTSWSMATRRDPWVNMLRGTLACFAAGVGGAEAVTVLPFDVALGLPDPLARRVARNTQSLLQDESNLAKVIDPGGGSWYLESLTRDLARRAWELFRELEATGGIVAGLASGAVADALDASRAERAARIAHRAGTITGVSEFPLLHETPLERRPYPARPARHGLPRVRHAEPYEALRDRADALGSRLGRAPAVFVAAIGTPREHAGRVGFLSGALAPGGIDVVVHPQAEAAADLGEGYAAVPGSVAAICGTDDGYAAHAEQLATRLRALGATTLIVAGRPAAVPGLAAEFWLHLGADLLTPLGGVLDALEASA